MKAGIFNYHEIKPLAQFGFTHNFWTLHIDTLIYTWSAMLILFVLAIVGNKLLRVKPNKISFAFEKSVSFFIDLCKESFGVFNYNYFAFIATVFFFTLFCCLIGLIPFLDESTKDLNTTFAIGLTSFIYVQYQKIKVHGVLGYLKEFIQPFFLLAPINIVGELAKIASMSFRLFGNILGGGIIFTMMVALLEKYSHYFLAFVFCTFFVSFFINQIPMLKNKKWPSTIIEGCFFIVYFIVWAQMFFGIFEGLIQAFVLTMLTTTYLAMGVASENNEEKNLKDNSNKKISKQPEGVEC
jgi:F-type H+-transporting ATPase subunit a